MTDKHTYDIGEPVIITYTGPHGSATQYTPPGPPMYHFIIKNEFGDTIVDEPSYGEISLMVCIQWYGTVGWTWNQAYMLYGVNRAPNVTIPPTGDQVPPGKYSVWFNAHSHWGYVGPAEFEIVDPSNETKEPLQITTDKYTYYQGEPVQITISGYRVGRSSDYGRGYLIKDTSGNWVRDPPQLHSTDIVESWGPDNHTWDQKYDIRWEFEVYGNYQVHYLNDSHQVPTGKYYIYPYPGNDKYYIYPGPGNYTPAEIEIIARPGLEIEKEKTSGPDEVFTHTYSEWELRITLSGPTPNKSYDNVVVYDVLPAELELLEYNLTRGNLTITKKGNGKMGAAHLQWNVGYLEGDAELVLKIATKKNHAGKQEFTSPGNYSLNDGAWLKGFDNSKQENIEMGPTDPIMVMVLEDPYR